MISMTDDDTDNPDTSGQPRDENGRFAPRKRDDEGSDSERASDESTEQLRQELSELKSQLQRMNEREQQLQLEKVRAEKLGELREIDPRLAEKYADETDPERIDLLIDTARSFKNNFAEYQSEEEGEKPRTPPSRIDLKTGDFV